MRKYINEFSLILLFVFVSLLFINPSKVNAISYKSDFVNLKDSVEFSTDEFTMDLEYKVFTNGTSDKSSAIKGYAVRKMEAIYYYHYIAYYYNSNKEEIGATDGYDIMWKKSYSKPTVSPEGSIIITLNQSNMYDGYKLSDIKYYKLFIEPTTEEIAHNYLYNHKTKLNPNGLDSITDFNTVEMTATPLKTAHNSDNYNNNYSNYNSNVEYTLNSYDINIIVNENNTLNITEKIGAYFNVEKHGIFRKIPLRNKVTRLDGTTSKNRVKISDIKVNDNYSLSTKNGYTVIKIGNAGYTLTGQKNYEISYLYNLGRDTGKEYDELYFNLIGNEWDTSISNVTFTITMPKEFDSKKLGFSSGPVGSTNSSKITYNVDGNIISGRYNGTLGLGEALTVRLELPEGYFVGASFNIDLMSVLAIVLPLLFVFITYLLWNKFGKEEQIVETVEFYPPQGLNSAEVGFLYKGEVENKDVISLLIYLANKGYIKIVETKKKSLFSTSKGFKIVKQKKYDGNNKNEALFLKGLFSSRKTSLINFSVMSDYIKNQQSVPEISLSNVTTEVTAMDLYNSFYKTLERIKANINSRKNKEKIFEKSSLGKDTIVIAMEIVTFVLITIKPVIESDFGIFGLPFAIFFPGFGFSASFSALLKKQPIYVKLFFLIWGLCFGGLPWLFLVLPSLLAEPIYLVTYIIGLVCILIMFLLLRAMPKRTKYGNEILGKIKGFKKFLETAEKQKLEAMVMENPTYFYDILPFTYVLGISDKWIKKFETISLRAPNWYDGYSSFNTATFGSFINSTMTSATSAMASSPSSSSSGSGGSSGGSSSGGGSSGGGSGGGGGGSW